MMTLQREKVPLYAASLVYCAVLRDTPLSSVVVKLCFRVFSASVYSVEPQPIQYLANRCHTIVLGNNNGRAISRLVVSWLRLCYNDHNLVHLNSELTVRNTI